MKGEVKTFFRFGLKAEVVVSDTNMASRVGWLFVAANVFLLLVQVFAG